MSVQQVLENLGERLHSSATVRQIFGEPITAEGKTIVPIARIGYGFGGGGGTGGTGEGGRQEGGGGGGGVGVVPVGVVEITADGVRFVPISSTRTIFAALGIGFLLGVLAARRMA
jgi:uncharacterized spore protein YtfJ